MNLDDFAADLIGTPRVSRHESVQRPVAPRHAAQPQAPAPAPGGSGGVKLLVHVAALDESTGQREVVRRVVEVPKGVMKLHGMLAESGGEVLQALAQSAVAAAHQSVSSGQKSSAGLLDEMASIGDARPTAGHQGAPSQARSVGGKLTEMLGLDIIEHMDAQDRGVASPSQGAMGGGPPSYVQQQAQQQAPRPPQQSAGPHTHGPRPPRVG